MQSRWLWLFGKLRLLQLKGISKNPLKPRWLRCKRALVLNRCRMQFITHLTLRASQKVFQGNVNIGGKQVTVRTVLNRLDRLHSVHIRR